MGKKNCLHLLSKGQRTGVADLFKSLKVMKFPNMIKLELSKFGAKVARRQIPKPIQQLMELRGGVKRCNYNTQRKEVPNIQRHRHLILIKASYTMVL